MSALPEDPQTAVILERIEQLRGDMADLKTTLATHGQTYVPRGEFEAWKTAFNNEIHDLKAARAPWWTWAALAVSGLSMLITLIQNIP